MTVAARSQQNSVIDGADRRKRDLARIHLLKKDLQLDDDAYRDLLHAIARVRSAGELDWTGRQRVLHHLDKLKKAHGQAERSQVKQQRLVRFLWHRLGELGALSSEGKAAQAKALDAWIKRETGVASLAWVKPADLRHVIEQLKRWVARLEKAPAAAQPDEGNRT